MRVAMLAPRPSVRGPLPKHTPILAEALRDLGCDVELLPWGRKVEGERLPAKLLGRVRDVVLARRTVVKGGYPVVVVKTAHDWLTLTRDLALIHLFPRDRVVVLQFHGSQSARLLAPGSRAFKRMTSLLLARADGVLVLSGEERAEWQAFSPRSHVSVVRNPRPLLSGDIVAKRHSVGGRKTILCVARLMPSKGVLDLVRALPLVRQTVSCRLVLAGEGPEQARLRTLATDLGVADWVDFPGYVEGAELAALYRSADVFALPTTHNEGFPTVILEAMETGLPIVTTPSRGAADHLVEGTHALFVPPHQPRALAVGLTRILTDHDLGQRLGTANRAKVHEFDADRVAKEYLTVLEAIVRVADGRRRAPARSGSTRKP
ncbi:MAG: glycosyltransferase family 4 protein [Gaiellaceae bacterium]